MAADDRPKRSLADDPNFMASLSDLDIGMEQEARPRSPTKAVSRSASRIVPLPGPQPVPPVAPPATTPPQATPPAQGSRRPLIDLFPPLDTRPASAPPIAGPSLAPPPVRFPSSAPAVAGTVTYETFYGLHEKPFSHSTDPKFLYHSAAHDEVAQALLGAIGRRERVVVLTGGLGLGKTTLCRAVIDQLDRRTLTSFVADPFGSVADLLKTVLVDFGVISREEIAQHRLAKASHAGLVAALHEFLVSLAALQAFAVIIVDDAHNLSVEVLDQVRIMVDGLGDEPLLQVVLVGEPSLQKTLGRSELRSLNQRVSVRCRLKPIAADDVDGYIAHRIAVAGTRPRVEFDDQAVARVSELSGGVPYIINQLCDRTMAAGFNVSASLLDGRLVETAAEELDLAPPSSQSWAGMVALIAGLLLLAVLGAAAAAFVFRSDLAALINAWQGP